MKQRQIPKHTDRIRSTAQYQRGDYLTAPRMAETCGITARQARGALERLANARKVLRVSSAYTKPGDHLYLPISEARYWLTRPWRA